MKSSRFSLSTFYILISFFFEGPKQKLSEPLDSVPHCERVHAARPAPPLAAPSDQGRFSVCVVTVRIPCKLKSFDSAVQNSLPTCSYYLGEPNKPPSFKRPACCPSAPFDNLPSIPSFKNLPHTCDRSSRRPSIPAEGERILRHFGRSRTAVSSPL